MFIAGEIVYESDDEMTKEECIEVAHKQFDVKSRRRRDAEKKFVGKIKEINHENFKSSIESGVTIVVFGMSWCQHCQSELELVTKVQAQNQFKNVNFALVNCATLTNLELCFDELRNGIPTVNTYIDGNRVVKDSKASTVSQYKDMIKAHVAGGTVLEEWKLKAKVKDSEEF